jgi:hypothetical protein
MGKRKRIADWLEKLSVAGLALGLFQGTILGLILGAGFFVGSLWLTDNKEN